jgi:hypothetical protein
MKLSGVPVPKREIIELILRIIPADQTREILKIQSGTDLHRRLNDFTKNQLLEVLQSTDEGKAGLEEAKAKYPLNSNPTLYLISVSFWPDRQTLFDETTKLAENMSDDAEFFGSDRLVKSVYMITEAREYKSQISFFELPIIYEKKIEYVESDPEAENYGEVEELYSLEKAIVWYNTRYKHAILLCGDYPAVKPILYYGKNKLGIRWQLPFLSEAMLQRLAEGANPRTASFSRLEQDPDDDLDVQTMIISDSGLGDSRSFRRFSQDEYRHQTSGFYSSHPDLVYGGLGIARQYGRIWTPARLRKDSLLALSINLIQKTEEELVREADINLGGFVGYYRNTPIDLAGKRINSSQRFFIEEITKAIISARRLPNNETVLETDFIWDLARKFEDLDLVPALEIQCENCGNFLLKCPICESPYEPLEVEQQLIFQCPSHPDKIIEDNQIFTCECGAENEITFSTDIRVFPGAYLLETLHEFLSILENQSYDGSFAIIGNILRLIPKRGERVNKYSLSSFRNWRIRARIMHRNLPENRVQDYWRILSRIKEKCTRNDSHPTREICANCMDEKITRSRIMSGKEICLPRIFGYAIDMDFDGVHHGHEIADIRYDDVLEETGEQLALAIHLKSRVLPKKRGLGRSVSCIKGLFTQYCYSVYLAAMRGEKIDVIGISVPNAINDQVINNFEYLAMQLGFPLIILSEDEWVNILDSAFEKVEVELAH